MHPDLERRIQDAIYECLRLIEHNDLASVDAATLETAASAAEALAQQMARAVESLE